VDRHPETPHLNGFEPVLDDFSSVKVTLTGEDSYWTFRFSGKAPYASTQEKDSLDAIMQTGVSNTVGLPRKGPITSCAYVVRFRGVHDI